MQAWGFLKRRAIVAALGALLVFSIGGGITLSRMAPRVAPTGQASAANTTTATDTTNSAAATATMTTSASAGAPPTATTAPTATAIPSTPTPRPQPTPVSVPAGQSIQIQGKVFSTTPSANSFIVQVGSKLYTVVVDANTTYPGSVKSVNQLSNGMDVNVQGAGNSNSSGSILASSVDAQGDN